MAWMSNRWQIKPLSFETWLTTHTNATERQAHSWMSYFIYQEWNKRPVAIFSLAEKNHHFNILLANIRSDQMFLDQISDQSKSELLQRMYTHTDTDSGGNGGKMSWNRSTWVLISWARGQCQIDKCVLVDKTIFDSPDTPCRGWKFPCQSQIHTDHLDLFLGHTK